MRFLSKGNKKLQFTPILESLIELLIETYRNCINCTGKCFENYISNISISTIYEEIVKHIFYIKIISQDNLI